MGRRRRQRVPARRADRTCPSTTNNNAEDFTDYGGTTQQGSTATHHLTLYRAPSGALVFGAGTVQWAWGLDNGGTSNPVDSAMQQATVNLFADMGVQPATLISGLTAGHRVDRHHRAHVDDHVAGSGRQPVERFGRDHQRDRDRHRRRCGRRRRGLDRRRHDLASRSPRCPPRTPPSPGVIRGSRMVTRPRRSSPGRSTTAATWRARRRARRST